MLTKSIETPKHQQVNNNFVDKVGWVNLTTTREDKSILYRRITKAVVWGS